MRHGADYHLFAHRHRCDSPGFGRLVPFPAMVTRQMHRFDSQKRLITCGAMFKVIILLTFGSMSDPLVVRLSLGPRIEQLGTGSAPVTSCRQTDSSWEMLLKNRAKMLVQKSLNFRPVFVLARLCVRRFECCLGCSFSAGSWLGFEFHVKETN